MKVFGSNVGLESTTQFHAHPTPEVRGESTCCRSARTLFERRYVRGGILLPIFDNNPKDLEIHIQATSLKVAGKNLTA